MPSLLFQPSRTASASLHRASIISALAMMVGGCASEAGSDPGRQSVGQVIQPIIGGTASGANHDAVILLTNFKGGVRQNLCSATLVAPNLVLTARHCVSDSDGPNGCKADGTAAFGGVVRADRPPQNLVVFTSKNGVPPDSEKEANGAARGTKLVVDPTTTTLCNHDLAFVVLDAKLDAPTATLRLTAPTAGERVSAIGFGVDATGKLTATRTIRDDLPIALGPSAYADNPSYGYGNAELMVGEAACAGDSGGPALAASGSVIGVASRAGNGLPKDPKNYATTCMGTGAHTVYSSLSAHAELVTRAFQEAGATPKLEAAPIPTAGAETSSGSGATTAASEPEPDVVKHSGAATIPIASAEGPPAAPPSAGGCTITEGPQKGAVEQAAGLIALIATLVGLRRRLLRKDDTHQDDGHRERMPSIP